MSLMTWKYAGYTHPPGEVVPESFDTTVQRNARGFATSITKTMSLRVNIVATGDTVINQRIGEIEAAYSLDGGDAYFLMTNGQPSNFSLLSGSSLYGVQVDGPHWSVDPKAADFVTGISCTIGLKAEYPTLVSTNPFVGSSESFEVIGTGGPRFKLTELDNDKPQVDQVSPATPVYVVQSGEAVNELTSLAPPLYPAFNQYLFPDNILNPDQDVRQRRDRRRSREAGRATYVSAWNYVFTFTEYPFVPNP